MALLLTNWGSSCGKAYIDPTSSLPRVAVLARSCIVGFNSLGPALGFVMEHQEFQRKNFHGIDLKYDNAGHYLVNLPIKVQNKEGDIERLVAHSIFVVSSFGPKALAP